MSDDKTEEPTQKKIDEAREKGQVSQSQDFTKLMIAAVVLQIILGMTSFGIDKLKSGIDVALLYMTMNFSLASKEIIEQSIEVYLSLLIIILAPAVLVRLVATWAQLGLLIAPQALMPKLEKLNPMNAAKNLITKQKFIELLLNLLKVCIVSTAMLIVLKPAMATLFLIPHTDLSQLIDVTNRILTDLQQKTLGMLFVIAGADFVLKKHFHKKGLMMSKDDIKQEYKQAQGDPQVKGQRKQMARQMANEPVKSGGKNKKPDAVVVNPTHYAVALHYSPGETPLPVILDHGEDDSAKAIIKAAHQQGVPVIRYVWLARRLCTMEAGSYIPKDSLEAVAEIYHLLQDLEAVIAGEVIAMDR